TAAADVAPRTFFAYFQSKEDVVLDEGVERFVRAQQALQQRPQGEPLLAAFRRAALETAADMQTQSEQERAIARIVHGSPALQARIRGRVGPWGEPLGAQIGEGRKARPDGPGSAGVAPALVRLLRSAQRVAVPTEMRLDLPALMAQAFDL